MKKIIFIFLCILLVLSVPVYAGNAGSDIISRARSLIGTPYRYGGTTPAGFDCSGFITYLFKKYVSGLPRISRYMVNFGTRVAKGNIQPGDLLFFATGKSSSTITHVALYIGRNAIVHSVSGGPQTGVIMTSLDTRYWKKRYVGAVRVLKNIRIAKESESSSPAGSGAGEQVPPGESAAQPLNPSVSASDSPWNTFDGIIEGDFNLWLEKDKNAFEEWKKNN